jgi:hypothetical protein
MNEAQIEILLKKGPAVRVPEGLERKLIADIRLPRREPGRQEWRAPEPWFKRWAPAMSFAVILLGCVVAIAVQTNMLSDLKATNAGLQAGAGNVEKLRADHAEFERVTLENGQLERLRKDNAELEKLRGDMTQMRGQLQGLGAVQAENARLKAAGVGVPEVTEYATADAQAEAERINCINNLKQVGLAARIWSGDNKDIYPSNYISMTNEMVTWKILQCPSDKGRTVSSWDDVANGNVSYPLLAPGATYTDPNQVFAICPVHGSILLIDGSVQYVGVTNLQKRLKVVDGKTYFNR